MTLPAGVRKAYHLTGETERAMAASILHPRRNWLGRVDAHQHEIDMQVFMDWVRFTLHGTGEQHYKLTAFRHRRRYEYFLELIEN